MAHYEIRKYRRTVPAKCMLNYHRISYCGAPGGPQVQDALGMGILDEEADHWVVLLQGAFPIYHHMLIPPGARDAHGQLCSWHVAPPDRKELMLVG